MKKILLIGVLIMISIITITGCGKKEQPEGKKIQTVSTIEIGKEQYIDQLKKVPIEGTDDYLIITEKRKWEVPEHDEGTTVNFSIIIPYTLHVDGKDYSAEYYLGDYQEENKDGNPKYNLTITDLTSNYETKVLIENK